MVSYSWGYKYSYSLTTTEKITTSSKKNRTGIGANADVFLGTTVSMLTGKAKSVDIINDSLYHSRQPAIEAGTMHVLAHGTDADGNKYHLVTGEKVVLGSTLSNTFVYSQYHILNTVIPRLALERYNLLQRFNSEAEAQAAADASNNVVYWYIDSTQAVSLKDTLLADTYKMILPTGTTKAYNDRVGALDNMIKKWWAWCMKTRKRRLKPANQVNMWVPIVSISAIRSLTPIPIRQPIISISSR